MLSPQQIGTICLVFSLILISAKSYSENIPSNPTCDNATLGVYSGSAALEPDWGANKIPIRWYNNNTLITDVTVQESECTYDSTIDVATAPSRTGYTFRGWKVRPEMDFNTLTSLSTGIMGYGKGSGFCAWYESGWHQSTGTCKTNAKFHDLNNHEWKTEFSTGTVYGTAHCSAKSGNHNHYTWDNDRSNWAATLTELDEDTTNEKKYCWCLATVWQPSYGQIRYSSSFILSWVKTDDYDKATACSGGCAAMCSYYVRNYSGFRAALFAPATNNQ